MTATHAEVTRVTSTPRPRSTRWAAYATCAWTLAYGALKLYWALGGATLMAEAPLPHSARELLLARDPRFVASHWAFVGAAIVGALVALATVQPWGRKLPRWLLLTPASMACAFMVLRAVLAVIGDVQQLSAEIPADATRRARWDLLLWSPYFLVWGILWGATAWSYMRGSRDRRVGVI